MRDARLRRYPLRRHRLSVAGGTLSIVAPDSGAWLHDGGWSERAERGGEPPYWADVWPASVAVARWLARRHDLAGRSVLDLGCGIGVPGAMAAARGARVVFADREADALAFAEFNGRRAAAAGAAGAEVRAELLDWSRATVPGTFDVLCLADVTYRAVHHEPVLRQVSAALGHDGLAVHCDPFRDASDGFLAQARSAFAVRTVASRSAFGDDLVPVRLAFVARTEAALDRWLGTPSRPSRVPA